MSEPVKRYILLKFPQRDCDLSCSYCYLNRRKYVGTNAFFRQRPPEKIAAALAPERIGGKSFFYAYSDGEPLLHNENLELLSHLTKRGHFAAVTTNLNCVDPASAAAWFSPEARGRMLFFASLHYLELRRRNRLALFFDTLHQLRKDGFSLRIRLCLAPEYLPWIKEIDAMCLDRAGQLPLLTRWRDGSGKKIDMSTLDRIGERSPVYRLQRRCVDQKRTEFCLAGKKSCLLDLETGEFHACVTERACGHLGTDVGNAVQQLPDSPVGRNCSAGWCMCCSHLLPWGVIPELYPGSYAELFFSDCPNSLSPELLDVLSMRHCNEYSDPDKELK